MRALLVALVLVTACHKPAQKRWSDRLGAVRDRVARAVKLDVRATVDAKALAATPPPAQRVREEPEPSRPAPTGTPAPTPSPAPPPIEIDRVDAARPSVFVLRGQTHGGKEFCEAHATLDACSTSCTAMLRANALQKPAPSSPKHCACTEQDRGC